jgi:hypothetical protein
MYQKKIPMNFEGVEYRVRIEQASEPEDILWDNIGKKLLMQGSKEKIFTFEN